LLLYVIAAAARRWDVGAHVACEYGHGLIRRDDSAVETGVRRRFDLDKIPLVEIVECVSTPPKAPERYRPRWC
jgi:hypothetical protein